MFHELYLGSRILLYWIRGCTRDFIDGYSVYGSDCKHSSVEAEVLKMKISIKMVFLYLLCSMVAQCVLCKLWRTHTRAEEKCERKEAAEGKPHTLTITSPLTLSAGDTLEWSGMNEWMNEWTWAQKRGKYRCWRFNFVSHNQNYFSWQ